MGNGDKIQVFFFLCADQPSWWEESKSVFVKQQAWNIENNCDAFISSWVETDVIMKRKNIW